MHEGEISTDAALVRRLLREQFPGWADLPITRVPSDGTDNAIYRLGDDRAVRLPRIDWAIGQVEKEHEWLPRLAPHLPLALPVPLAMGQPGAGYPWRWSIYEWLEGEDADIEHMADPRRAALDLATFIAALQRIDTTGAPRPAPHDSARGQPLRLRDEGTRQAIATLRDAFDLRVMSAVWEAALAAPEWVGAPVWIHGYLKPGNLLAVAGRLSAVIDFASLAVGDPAADVMAAWLFLSAGTRDLFRAALHVDDATWARGRGLALSVGVVALPYYERTNPGFAAAARRAIRETLTDFEAHG